MTLLCEGLDGTNPLHFLASLGVFRLLTLRHFEARMRWEWHGGWRPEYHWDHSEEGEPMTVMASYLGAWLRELGRVENADAILARRIRDLTAELKRLRDERSGFAKESAAVAKSRKLARGEAKALETEACADHDLKISEKMNVLELSQTELNNSLGIGIAHLGDIISIPARLFRSRANSAVAAWLEPSTGTEPCRDHPQLVAEALAAHACDAVTDNGGKVQPTPYSFSNGASGQCLLKDFRSCAITSSDIMVAGTLQGSPVTTDRITGLNWNPSDQRSYALQWHDPSSGSADDPVVNSLAFVGLSLLTAVPAGLRLGAMGWIMTRGENGFVWPIWDEIIGLDEVRGLLALTPDLADRKQNIAAMGIYAILKSNRINPTGKRNFFAPANWL